MGETDHERGPKAAALTFQEELEPSLKLAMKLVELFCKGANDSINGNVCCCAKFLHKLVSVSVYVCVCANVCVL